MGMCKKKLQNILDLRNPLMEKVPVPDYMLTSKVKIDLEWDSQERTVGLLIMERSYSYIGLCYDADGFWIKQIVCDNAEEGNGEKLVAKEKLNNGEVLVRMQASAENANLQFKYSYSVDGILFREFGEEFYIEGHKGGKAQIGIFAVSKDNEELGYYSDFEWYRLNR